MSKQRNMSDVCWDKLCPENSKSKKESCLYNRAFDICDCCRKSGGDCNVLVPGIGLIDICGHAQRSMRDTQVDTQVDTQSKNKGLMTAVIIVSVIIGILILIYLISSFSE